MSESFRGLVVKSTGSWYDVRTEEQTIIRCRIIGKFRLKGLKLTNPVAVGDFVRFTIEKQDQDVVGNITEIEDRHNYVVRQSPRKKHHVHLLASNIDHALLVVTIREPKLKPGFIDRFLVMTEPYNIPVDIVFNKSDLYDENDLAIYQYLQAVYENIGYKTHLVSSIDGLNIEPILELLKNKTTMISGQSGVGKSTLLNALLPDMDLRTNEVSDYTGKGQHTTTFAEMFPLPFGGNIVDTPGIKMISFNHLEVQDVAHNFKEIFALSSACKFSNCTHRNEPKCAVKDAIEEGAISEMRYSNYLQIIQEIEDQNYWERHNEI